MLIRGGTKRDIWRSELPSADLRFGRNGLIATAIFQRIWLPSTYPTTTPFCSNSSNSNNTSNNIVTLLTNPSNTIIRPGNRTKPQIKIPIQRTSRRTTPLTLHNPHPPALPSPHPNQPGVSPVSRHHTRPAPLQECGLLTWASNSAAPSPPLPPPHTPCRQTSPNNLSNHPQPGVESHLPYKGSSGIPVGAYNFADSIMLLLN